MATQDPIPGPGSEAGEPCLRDRARILAYLEDLQGSAAEVRLVVQGHAPLPARILEVAEQPPRLRVRLGRPLPVTWIRRKEIELLFTLDGIRFLAPVRFLERAGYLEAHLSLPLEISHADRRSRMRAHFGPREKATVTALEGLMGPRGATGHLLDLSLEGLRMRVDRAVTVRGKAPLAVTAATFPAGTRFPILRIDQLPHAPVIVCAGVVAHASALADAVQIGVRFEQLGEMEAQVIRQVLGRRLPKFSAGFPERRREGAQAEPGPKVTVTHHGRSQEPAPAGDPARAARRLLLVVADDLDRTILASTLRQDGFRRIHEARDAAAALDHVKVFPMDVVILEETVGAQPAEAVLARLRQAGMAAAVPVLLLTAGEGSQPERPAAPLEHLLAMDGDYDGTFRRILDGLLALS